MATHANGGDDELAFVADPSLEQHFLISPQKLSLLIDAAEIRLTDDVVELGAGAGTVARSLPKCRSLTVVELDKKLLQYLRKNVPAARIIQGDALDIVQNIRFDVLIGNLPNAVTESLLRVLPSLSFRTAVLAVGESSRLEPLETTFHWREIGRITGNDFMPPQAEVSRLVALKRIGR